MRVFRAHDGRSINVNQPLAQFQTLDDLLDCFSLATEIPSDSIICMTSDGSQLKDELIQQIAQQEEQQNGTSSSPVTEFYVFNRNFLYTDPEALAQELAENPVLEPGVSELEFVHSPTPKSLEALVSWSNQVVSHVLTHKARSKDYLDHIGSILRSTNVALLNLLSHAESIKKGADALGELAGKELTRMETLLNGHERDLQVLGMVGINPRLLAVSNSSADGRSRTSKERTLGDYVSRVKMGAVAEACTKVYTELCERITTLEQTLAQLEEDTSALTNELDGTDTQPSAESYQEVSEAAAQAKNVAGFIEDNCSPDAQGWPVADKLDPETYDDVVRSTDELLLLDEVARQSVARLTHDRNDMMARCLHFLQDISSLQSEYADLGTGLAAVDADLNSNKVDGFKHLNRLKNMLWAYGATVIEVVRRREFSKHFLGKSQSLAELMAKMSASERKRRQDYRSHVFGQLPWEVRGMEEMAPSLEITTTRTGGEAVADLGREDLDALIKLLDLVDKNLAENTDERAGPSPIPEVKAALEQLAAVLDDLDAEYIHLVNTQLLGQDDQDGSEEDESGSDTSIRAKRTSRNRKKLLTANRSEIDALQKRLKEERVASGKRQQEAEEQHKAELEKVRSEMEQLRQELAAEKAKTESMQKAKEEAKARAKTASCDLETERERRLNMADEVSNLRLNLEEARKTEAEARREVIEEGNRANEMEGHLHEMQIELDEAKAARLDASNRIEALLSEGSSAEQELRAAQVRIDELTEHVSAAHAEVNKAKDAITEVEAARERQIRSHRAEADGDRAILEEKVRAVRSDLQEALSRAKRAEDGRKPDQEAMELLRSQLRAADDAHEEIVKEMEQAKEVATQAEASRKDTEISRQQLLEKSRALLAKSHLLRKAVKAMPSLSSSKNVASTTTAQRLAASSGAMTLSVVSETEKQATMEAFEAEMETADLDVVLEALRVFDPIEMHDEIKAKLYSLTTLIRKWQKAYKNSNEKTQKALAVARDKIAFRNFQSGDLALFLPTRNSTAKPWAAFNISFPHFFLRTTGQLAEQLKAKEWIVARIARITDRIATRSKADDGEDGNPFQLAEGVRFYLLDVETWDGNSPAPPSLRSRKSSAVLPSINGENGHGKDRRPERRRSDTMPHPAAVEAKPEKAAEVQAEKEEQQRQSFHRRASEGDRPTGKEERNSPTPPMLIPEASPPRRLQPLPGTSAPLLSPPSRILLNSNPSALTRALRATSPLSTRLTNRGYPFSENESTDGRSAIIERAAAAPAFGRGRLTQRGGLVSAPCSHTQTQGIGIPSTVGEVMSNPFSQSPGVSSMPERDVVRRKSSLVHKWEQPPKESKADGSAAVPQRISRRTGSTGIPRTPSMVVISGNSLVLDPIGGFSSSLASSSSSGNPRPSLATAVGQTSSPTLQTDNTLFTQTLGRFKGRETLIGPPWSPPKRTDTAAASEMLRRLNERK